VAPIEIATLIQPLDEHFVGIRPGQLATVMSPSGIGKSFMLVHLGKAALIQGFKVFHYSLEMSREEIVERYDRMIAGATEKDLARGKSSRKLMRNAENLVRRGGSLHVFYAAFEDPKKPTLVDAFIRHYKKRCEAVGKPDLLLLDYGDWLAKNIKSRYEEQGAVWRALKNFAVSEQIAIWVTTQAARTGVGAKRITELEVGDSYEKVRISDIFIGFNRNIVFNQKRREWMEQDDQYNPDTVRLHVIKHRGRKDKYDVRFVSNFERGVFYDKRASDELYGQENVAPLATPPALTD
jgi:hypothetical protein